MKAILEFNLPEETEEHEQALNGWKYQSVLNKILNYLHSQEELGKDSLTIEEIRKSIIETRDQRGIYE